MVMQMPQPGGGGTAPAPYIDYSQGGYSDPGVQQFLQTMLPRWNTQWEDPNMQGGYVAPGGSAVTLGGVKGLTDKALQDFTQQVQAVTGQAPTAEQINQFFTSQLIPMASQAQPGGYNPISPQDITNAIQQYVPTAFSNQIQGYQQQQQTDALNKNINTGQGLINSALGNFSSNLTDPNNPMYQQFSGQMNNLGISPTSGAFQAGLGGTIANEGANLEQQLMSSLGFPALGGIQNLSGQANNSLNQAQPVAQGNLTSQQNNLSDFGREQSMAQQLMESMQGGGGVMSYLPQLLSGAGQAAGGAAQAKQATWICTAMVKHGAMTADEVKRLHDHLFKAFWKRPFKFLGYFAFGKFLVWLAESVNTRWSIWKPSFYQDVMAESDPVKALDLYEQAFWDLFRNVRHRVQMRKAIS